MRPKETNEIAKRSMLKMCRNLGMKGRYRRKDEQCRGGRKAEKQDCMMLCGVSLLMLQWNSLRPPESSVKSPALTSACVRGLFGVS